MASTLPKEILRALQNPLSVHQSIRPGYADPDPDSTIPAAIGTSSTPEYDIMGERSIGGYGMAGLASIHGPVDVEGMVLGQ
jgi:hypothetical protein